HVRRRVWLRYTPVMSQTTNISGDVGGATEGSRNVKVGANSEPPPPTPRASAFCMACCSRPMCAARAGGADASTRGSPSPCDYSELSRNGSNGNALANLHEILLGAYPGLKIRVSAVRFCPWPLTLGSRLFSNRRSPPLAAA